MQTFSNSQYRLVPIRSTMGPHKNASLCGGGVFIYNGNKFNVIINKNHKFLDARLVVKDLKEY